MGSTWHQTNEWKCQGLGFDANRSNIKGNNIMLENAKVLVLDNGYQPLGIVSWERAITLFYQEKVEILQEYSDMWIHSARQTFKVPSVIKFISKVIKKMRKVKFSRENVYLRDKGKCQYCSIPVSRQDFTVDHVIPRSNGGKTEWSNIVICCVECNRFKKNRTPLQAGMKLKTEPVRPKTLFQTLSWMSHMPLSWRDFLYWNGELENDIS